MSIILKMYDITWSIYEGIKVIGCVTDQHHNILKSRPAAQNVSQVTKEENEQNKSVV